MVLGYFSGCLVLSFFFGHSSILLIEGVIISLFTLRLFIYSTVDCISRDSCSGSISSVDNHPSHSAVYSGSHSAIYSGSHSHSHSHSPSHI